MNTWFFKSHDLTTPDGKITHLTYINDQIREAEVLIDEIAPNFVGFSLPNEHLLFNLKSVLAQIGIETIATNISLSKRLRQAHVTVKITAIGHLAYLLLHRLKVGDFIGKLFALDENRIVRNPDYLLRMLGRSDRFGRPLLSFGLSPEQDPLHLEKRDGRTIAVIPLKKGVFTYEDEINYFIPTIVKALEINDISLRYLLRLYQIWKEDAKRVVRQNELLLVRTPPLHIRTVFGKVIDEYLPKGVKHTSASILQPDTHASGDIYEVYGESEEEIEYIPLEFYTLSPYKEHVFFSDRDQLKTSLEDPNYLFKAFSTAPYPLHHKTAIYIVKGEQLLHLTEDSWIASESHKEEFPKEENPERMALMVDKYIKKQPEYVFLEAIQHNQITSQGVLLTRYFPSPRMKKILLSDQVQANLKGIYFQYPSRSFGMYFSHEDRSMLVDLSKLCIPVFWVDTVSNLLLKYVMKPEKDTGMFVPVNQVNTFLHATTIGVYGSNLLEGTFLGELKELLKGLIEMKNDFEHSLLNKETPLALVTGGGPGAMSVGNQVACELNILSCANIIDFSSGNDKVINEQQVNPYIQAKMTYRLDHLVERQAEFHLDLPIFLTGGIGTDFEYALEEIRRKVGIVEPTPILLFGSVEYWKDKITSRFQCNLRSGTIKGSEWISNCFFVIRNAKEGLNVYRRFFSNQLHIGKDSPIQHLGFVCPE
ncbi:MAG: hypothetical protein HY860_04765 [Chlamydiales bacterium]|nr:hypothetical protein [Chlamydiales bacterium]